MDRTKGLDILEAVLKEHVEEYGLDLVLNCLFDAILNSKRISGSLWERDRKLAEDLKDFIASGDGSWEGV